MKQSTTAFAVLRIVERRVVHAKAQRREGILNLSIGRNGHISFHHLCAFAPLREPILPYAFTTALDRAAKLLRSFCSLGGITAMQYGFERPDVSQ